MDSDFHIFFIINKKKFVLMDFDVTFFIFVKLIKLKLLLIMVHLTLSIFIY